MNTTVENPKDASDDMTDKAYVRDHIETFAKPDATLDEVDGLDATPAELLAESYQQEALYDRAHDDTGE